MFHFKALILFCLITSHIISIMFILLWLYYFIISFQNDMKRAITAAKQYTNKSIAHYSLFCFSLLRTYKMLNLIGSKRRSFY